MTRINVVPPTLLSDKHAMAEYKEITRPFNKAMKHAKAGRLPSDLNIPANYCLGTGHETFFFDKLTWLMYRRDTLYWHLKAKDYNLDHDLFEEVQLDMRTASHIHTEFFNDFKPTSQDIYLNMARLILRSEFTTDKAEVVRGITQAEINFGDYL